MSTVDISVQAKALVKKLGVEHERIASLYLTPDKATVILFKENEHGRLYIDPQTNETATEVMHFDVKT